MAQQIDYSGSPQLVIDYSDAPLQEESKPIIDYSDAPLPEQERGLLGRTWDWMTSPVTKAPGEFLRNIATSIDEPALERGPFEAAVRGGLAGMIGGTEEEIPLIGRGGLAGEVDITASPLGLAGLAARPITRGVTGGINQLRRMSRLGKVADVAEDVPTGIMSQKTPLAARPQIFPDVKLPARDRLKEALGKTKLLNEQQKEIYAKELRDRLEEMGKVETPGLAGHRERKSLLAGEYKKVEIEPLSKYLSEGDLNELIDEVQKHADLMPLEKVRAVDALELKLFSGQVPQPNEIKLLRKVFGDEINDKLIEIAAKKPSIVGKVGEVVSGTQDLMRALLTSYDLSPVGRQGRLFVSYPEYWKAFPTMVKSWGKDFFKANQAAIRSHPNFTRPRDAAGQLTGKSIAERGGLDLTDLTTNREEIFLSKVAQKIPGIPASNRAYVGYLNKLRSDMFNRLVKETGGDILKNDVKLQAIGKLINNATGRGKLPGMLEGNARLMNQLFFAPRLHAGKLRMYGQVFNPKFYTETDAVVRKAALRSLITSTSFSVAVGSLFAQMGADVSNDPTSSDFRKIRFGNIRVDTFGGDQQYAVAVARLMTGESTSSTSGRVTEIYDPGFGQQSAGGVLADFLANRLAPIPSMAVNLMFNKSYGDEDFGIMSELADKTVPIMVQDIIEIIQEDPDMWPALIPAALGIGLQAYGR